MKPLTYALMQRSNKASPRQASQLSFTAQFTKAIEFLPGRDNIVADSISRIHAFRLSAVVSLNDLAAEQKTNQQLLRILEDPDYSLNMQKIMWGPEQSVVL